MPRINITRDHLDYLQRAIELEAGRSEVLRSVARGDSIEVVLRLLCEKSEIYNPEMKSSVLLLDHENGTLHPIASVSLPADYCKALDGVKIGMGVGSCGTAAFSKKRVVVTDINTDPIWAQYKDLALNAGLQSCWSEPIMGSNKKVYGTFAMYYAYPNTPTEEDIAYIETCANLAAIVFENVSTRQALVNANTQLSQTVDERNTQLTEANTRLSLVLEQQKAISIRDINAEKASVTNMLLMGVAHEINTPLGVAITSISSSSQIVTSLSQDIEQGKLTKSSAMKTLSSLSKSIDLTLNNLTRASNLLERFSEIDTEKVADQAFTFEMPKFIQQFSDYARLKYPNIAIESEVQEGLECYSQASFFQLLSQLLDNSVFHGFENQQGKVFISVVQDAKYIHVSYHDNGKGISKLEAEKVFQPFFSTQRGSGKMGLGLNIVCNIISNIYKGQIELVDSPVGVRYKMTIPRTD
ncbi:GAF domain-containing sensor histidine kinase [uncultured Paraglaciecola sp.]|uniref:GAF domain-containing sensor histidine kinase n=1 Tax=uncultured Paraglaciecola sp. TaxID=1765024 RepID=UPI0030D94B19|tara:strand:- start:12854 stop:14257 length:1404 start_codon:yes stop_codon:yes gene_type:complete